MSLTVQPEADVQPIVPDEPNQPKQYRRIAGFVAVALLFIIGVAVGNTRLIAVTEEISVAAGSYDVSGMVSACRRLDWLTSDAEPMPVDSVDRHWQDALSYFQLAADACIEGGTELDTDRLLESVTWTNLATESLGLATDALGGL